MNRPSLNLQPSEAVVVRAATEIYAAYISTNRVPEGKEKEWMERAIKEAIWIAKTADDMIQSDSEMG